MKNYRLGMFWALISFGFFLFGNHLLPVMDPVESNYALTAKEMVLSGDWLSPQIYHQYWFDKPIMIYWLIALSYKVFGFTDFAARFPAAVFSAMTVGLMYQCVKTIGGRTLLATWAALILGTSLEFWVMAHGIVTDSVLIWATMGIMGYAYLGLQDRKPLYIAIAYAFAGIAVLTKGPVGIVLPGILLLVFAGMMRSLDIVKRLFPWQGILAFCLVALPWYIMMYHIHGQAFIDGFLGLHNYVRATVSEHPEDNKWYYYLVILPVSLLPWTGPVLYEMVKGFSRKFFYVYLMTWGWGTILFYTLMATKYPTYTFIALIPFSVLGAIGMVRLVHHNKRRFWTILTGPAIFLWLLLVAGTFFVKWGFWLLLYVIVAMGILSVLYYQSKGKKYILPLAVGVVTAASSMVFIYEGLVPFAHQRSSVDLVETVKSFDGEVYAFDDYQTSLVFYSDKEIVHIESGASKRQTGVWANKYTMPSVKEDALEPLLAQGKAMMIMVPLKNKDAFDSSAIRSYFEIVKTSDDGKEALYQSVKK